MRNWQSIIALAALTVAGIAAAQTPPPAPPPKPTTEAAQVASGPHFPPPSPANFTADTPSVETVNAFLKQLWGYDPQRVWQVEGIQKTQVPGLSRVTLYVAQGSDPSKVQGSQFFVLPDGKHAISDDVISFGAQPFAETRDILKSRAAGPAKGAAGKDLLFVEFSDFQCPHCKDAQGIIEHLMQDFPNARLIYENYPLLQIHPASQKAAEYGVCVAQAGGGDAFFKYATSVFDKQAALTPEGTAQTLKNAVTAAGQSPDKIDACLADPQTKAAVAASVKLAQDLNVNSTPTLFVNGRPVPVSSSVPYETSKSIVAFQLQNDGLAGPAAKLSSLSK